MPRVRAVASWTRRGGAAADRSDGDDRARGGDRDALVAGDVGKTEAALRAAEKAFAEAAVADLETVSQVVPRPIGVDAGAWSVLQSTVTECAAQIRSANDPAAALAAYESASLAYVRTLVQGLRGELSQLGLSTEQVRAIGAALDRADDDLGRHEAERAEAWYAEAVAPVSVRSDERKVQAGAAESGGDAPRSARALASVVTAPAVHVPGTVKDDADAGDPVQFTPGTASALAGCVG